MAQTDLINEGLLAEYHDELMKTHIAGGCVFDISAYHATGTPPVPVPYANLAAALGTNGANIPEPLRKGGMSVKFVQSSDNKYVQYRLMSDTFNTTVTNWQGVDDEPTPNSENLIKSGGVEQCNYDTTVRLANIEESINGEPTEKELIFEDETFTLPTLSQTEILLPIPTSIGNIGTTYIVTISGNVRVTNNGKFNISIVSGSLNLTDIDQSLIGKDLSSGIRVKLILKSSTDAACNLKLLCSNVQPTGQTIHVKLERFTTSDAADLKQYGTDNLLDLLHFEEHKVINTADNQVSLTPSSTASDIECCVIKCKEGNEFIINGTGYSRARLWAFADVNGNILSRSDANLTAESLVLTADSPNTAFLIINKTIDSNVCYTKQTGRLLANLNNSIAAASNSDRAYTNEKINETKGLIDLSSLTKYAFYISESTAPYTWSNGSKRRSVVIPVQPRNILLIESKEGMSAAYMFLSNFAEPITAGDTAYNVGDKVIINKTTCINVPDTANYVYILLVNSNSQTPVENIFVCDDEVLIESLNKVSDDTKEYADEKDTQIINDLPNYIQQTEINVQNLNQKTYGFQDVIGSWWFYPEAVSNITYRKKLFFGFVDKEGFSGVAELTCDSKQPMLIKNRLKHEYPDTHDSVSVTVLDDGRLLAVFPDGHNTGKYINIRVSKNKYSIDEFEAPIRIPSDIGVAYSQVHKVNGKYYVFFRSPIKYWRYIESEDLVNWTSPKIFLHDSADFQRYLLLKPIANEPNKLRFATYSNPTYDDTNIRCGYIDFETNKVYDSTGTEVGTFGGDTPVETDDLTVLVAKPESPYKNRLFDLAVTPLNIYRFTYAYFNNSSGDDGTDTIYYLYDNGTVKSICAGGQAFWIPKAPSGVQFLSATKMVVARSDVSSTGYDYIDIYDLVDGNVTFVKELYKELKTGLYKNRNGYVLADINGRYVIWFRGYYASYGSSSTYMRYDYDTDVMIYDIENDKLLGGDY